MTEDRDELTAEVARIFENGRTQRYAIVCGTIVVCAVTIGLTIQSLARPAWLDVLGYLAPPGAVLAGVIQAWKTTTSRQKNRIEALQRIVEEQRDEILRSRAQANEDRAHQEEGK